MASFPRFHVFSKVFTAGLYECHKRLICLKFYFFIVSSLFFALYGRHKNQFF